MSFELDSIDKAILRHLVQDGRLPMADLARRVSLSAPSTGERVRRLQEAGIITGFTAEIDLERLGYGLEAIVRIKTLPGQVHRVQTIIEETPEIIACDKVTGADCFICRLVLRAVGDLDGILERVADYAETNTSIIKMKPVKTRLPLL